MKIITISNRLVAEEKESHLLYDYITRKWELDTTVLKHYNKAKRQNWTQTAEYVYSDGSVCGGAFEAPGNAITFRNPIVKNDNSESEDDEL